MLAFQKEPDKPTRCEKCHMVLIAPLKVTSEKDPYCMHCGHVLGTSVQPASWACEECSEIVLDTRPDDRPWCGDCKVPMSCLSAQPSRINGAGTGDADLDYGMGFLIEAQGAVLELGTELLRDNQS